MFRIFIFLFSIVFIFSYTSVQGMCLGEGEECSIADVHIGSFFYIISDIDACIRSRYNNYSWIEVETPILTLFLSEKEKIRIGPQGGTLHYLSDGLPLTLVGKLRSSIRFFPSEEEVLFSMGVFGKIPAFQGELLTQLEWDPELFMYRF